MSLDLYLFSDKPVKRPVGSGIFIRENGKSMEISREEWDRRNPDREPVVVQYPDSEETKQLYSDNITHNLASMAAAAGLLEPLWRSQGKTAEELIPALMKGFCELCSRPTHYRRMNPENGWGTYELLREFTGDFLLACIRYPKAKVEASV